MKTIHNFTKGELITYVGSYEDFPIGSDRFYAQWAVDFHGAAVRNNSISELICIGADLHAEAESGKV